MSPLPRNSGPAGRPGGAPASFAVGRVTLRGMLGMGSNLWPNLWRSDLGRRGRALDPLGEPLVLERDFAQMILDRRGGRLARQVPHPRRVAAIVFGGQRRQGGGRLHHRTARSIAVAFEPLAQHLAVAADRLGLFAGAPLGRLLVGAPPLHLAERALALHLLLEDAQRGIDVVVAYENLHAGLRLAG